MTRNNENHEKEGISHNKVNYITIGRGSWGGGVGPPVSLTL